MRRADVCSRTLAIDLLVLPLMFSVAMFALLDPLMVAWRNFFELVAGPLGLPSAMGTRIFEIGPLAVPIPYFTAPGFWPEARDLQTGWLFTGILAGVGMLLRGRLGLPSGAALVDLRDLVHVANRVVSGPHTAVNAAAFRAVLRALIADWEDTYKTLG